MLRRLATACVMLTLASIPSRAQLQFPEIPNPQLNDIAVAMMTPQGPVVVYNPQICAQMGMFACRFFRAHEYAHIVLGHVIGTRRGPAAETEADCWAAQNAQEIEVTAAIQAFRMQGMGGDAAGHGTGFQRAQRVFDARRSGNCHW